MHQEIQCVELANQLFAYFTFDSCLQSRLGGFQDKVLAVVFIEEAYGLSLGV